MYRVSNQLRAHELDNEADAPVYHGSDISPELREVLHMLAVFEKKEPAKEPQR